MLDILNDLEQEKSSSMRKEFMTPDGSVDIASIFKELDREGDGMITAAELNHNLVENGIYLNDDQVVLLEGNIIINNKKHNTKIDLLMNVVDTDGNGKIDFEEFAEFTRKSIHSFKWKSSEV